MFWESRRILRNLHLTVDWHYIGQFCGLLRIYELYPPTLKIFEASYGTVTSDEIPSPMWDLILKGFKRNPTWAFEENKKKKQRRCSKHYAINLSVFEVFQFHQIFQSCPIHTTKTVRNKWEKLELIGKEYILFGYSW